MDINNSTDRDIEDRKKESAAEFKTHILDKTENIIKQITHLVETSSGLSIVSVSGGMQLIYNNFFDLYKNVLDNYKRGIGKGIRWIISIDKDNIDLVKIFLNNNDVNRERGGATFYFSLPLATQRIQKNNNIMIDNDDLIKEQNLTQG